MAGGLFGFGLGAVQMRGFGAWVGLAVGFVCASCAAIPVVATAAVITWAFWLSRVRILVAALTGGLTGVLVTLGIGKAFVLVVLAGICGASGAVAASAIHDWSCRSQPRRAKPSAPGVWQFTLRDLLWRMTVLAALLSVWVWGIESLRNAVRPTETRPQESREPAQASQE